MTMIINLQDYEIKRMNNLEVGDTLESCDIEGNSIYIERVNENYYGAVEINDKYFIANYFAPTKVIFKHDSNIYK